MHVGPVKRADLSTRSACSRYCFHNVIMSTVKPLRPSVDVKDTFIHRGTKCREGRVVMGGWMCGLLYYTLFLLVFLVCAILKNIAFFGFTVITVYCSSVYS